MEVYDVRDDVSGPFQSMERDRRDDLAGDPLPQEEHGEHGQLEERRDAGDSAQFLTQDKAAGNARTVARN